MDLFRIFRSGRGAGRRGQTPVVEAALRAKRARDHLARKRRRSARTDGLAAADRAVPWTADPVTARPPVPTPAAAGPSHARRPRRAPSRGVVPAAPPMPRFVVPATLLLAAGLGYAASGPLFVHVWLPRVPLTRVAVAGTAVREPVDVARALWPSAGAPLDRVDADHVRTRLGEDPWIESAESIRLPTGTLIVRVQERRAIARYRPEPEAELTLLDPTGRPFAGEVDAAGALPLVEGPIDGDASLSVTALEILDELARHGGLAGDPSRLTLHLPGSAGLAEPIRLSGGDAAAAGITLGSASDTTGRAAGAGDPPGPGSAGESEGESTEPPSILETLEGESGYVLAIGETGPRALLGQSFLKRRIARLALLLGERDALLARARIIDLRFADRAVLRTGPASG